MGKRQLTSETNAAGFLKIWAQLESVRLEAEALDKLALAPWRIWLGNTNATLTNSPASLLRPLLDDVIQQESYFEVRREATNLPAEFAFAVHLDPQRAALWRSNLTTVLESVNRRQSDA